MTHAEHGSSQPSHRDADTSAAGSPSPRSAIRVLLADDQDDVRSAFRFFLDAQPDIDVVGDAADGNTAYDLARRLRPDVCVFDIRMPGIDGLELTRRLAGPAIADPLNIVVVTTFDLDEYTYTALRNGACGFLLKDAGPSLLVEAVRAAAAGDSLISPSVTVRLLRDFRSRVSDRDLLNHHDPQRLPRLLTDRELDVVTLVAEGLTNAEIAARLYISFSTAKTHLAAAQIKIGARNRVEVAMWAWQTGYVHRRL